MSNFNTVETSQKPLDPTKRVKYTMGLVLGVDEFDQEQLYLMERDELHNRALHGYGTVCGLDVSVHDGSGDTTIMVSPGLALNPRGQTIRVCEDQCAFLNQWLSAHLEDVEQFLGSPPVDGPISLYLVLCYDECETDNVPIPGEPCRSRDDTMAASRIADHFKLSLEIEPPPQLEEDAVRMFGDFLRRIEPTGDITLLTVETIEEMEEMVRNLFDEDGSPPEASPPEASPPDYKIYIPIDGAFEYFRAIFRVWVTEIRPTILEKNKYCPDHLEGACVLLAQLDFDVQESDGTWGFRGSASDITIIEENRPILLHTRLLQEWHHKTGMAAETVGDAAGGDLGGTYPNPSVVRLQNRPVNDVNPAANNVLTWVSGQWTPSPISIPRNIQLPFVTIHQIEPSQFELWFNIDAPGNGVEISEVPATSIDVFLETNSPDSFLQELRIGRINMIRRNVWQIIVNMEAQEQAYLRFRFNLMRIRAQTPLSLTLYNYAQRNGIDFVGQSGTSVTTFFRLRMN